MIEKYCKFRKKSGLKSIRYDIIPVYSAALYDAGAEIEYKILLLLIQYPTKIFSLQNLYESIWEEPFISTSANTIMVHIRNLRTKIEENPQKPKIIQTVWGKGYRLG